MMLVMELYGPLYVSLNWFLCVHQCISRVKKLNNAGGKSVGGEETTEKGLGLGNLQYLYMIGKRQVESQMSRKKAKKNTKKKPEMDQCAGIQLTENFRGSEPDH